MTAQSLNKQLGIELVEKSLEAMEAKIKEHGGNLVIKMKPRAVTEGDEVDLMHKLREAEDENNEVAGDDEPDEYDDE